MMDGYIDPGHSAADQKLLEIFYRATNSEGGTADEIYLRGIHAVISHSLTTAAGAEALAVRPMMEQIAALGDCISQQTVGQIIAISQRAAAWLQENPPGQPVAIEPRGCPTPGACSCVVPAPSNESEAPTDQELLEVLDRATADFPPNHPEAESMTGARYALALEVRKARAVLARWGRPAPARHGAPAMTTPNRPPLWRVMDRAAYPQPHPPGHNYRAAEIRALRDWLVPEEVPPLGPAGKAHMQLRALLTAEADRAERGDD